MVTSFKHKIDLLMEYPFFRDFINSDNPNVKKLKEDLDLFYPDLFKKTFISGEIELIKRLSSLLFKIPKNWRYNDLVTGVSSDFFIFEIKYRLYSIEPLTYQTVRDTIEVVRKVFGDEPDYRIFPISLVIRDGGFKAFFYRQILLRKRFANEAYFWDTAIIELQYWVLMDILRQKVIGVTGLYCYERDQLEADWIGWMCVDPYYRDRKLGKFLLEFVIWKSKARGKKYLRLYTSTSPNEEVANRMYLSYGFRIFRKEPIKGENLEYLYMEKEIK